MRVRPEAPEAPSSDSKNRLRQNNVNVPCVHSRYEADCVAMYPLMIFLDISHTSAKSKEY